jgi:hypothetical protein
MQFKHPEILYALFLLIIPIIVHLFQLRRFQKVYFTNVKFLKKVELQTRKSSKLKKLLILLTRLLLFASLIFAFSQPYKHSKTSHDLADTYIYLDNSFSMEAKGKNGALLKRAAHDIINSTVGSDNIHLITNNETYLNLSHKNLLSTLLSIDYSSSALDFESVLLKIKTLIGQKKNYNNIFIVSDFQKINFKNKIKLDSLNNYYIIKLKSTNTNNISVDSVWVTSKNYESTTINALIKNFGKSVKNVSISLFNDDVLTGKSSINLKENSNVEVEFKFPNSKIFKGRLQIQDGDLNFDNSFYFLINNIHKVKVTAIGHNNDFLAKIYTKDDFDYLSTTLQNFNYNTINTQNLLVINELEKLSKPLINSIKKFTDNGGHLVIIPSSNLDIISYKDLFSVLALGELKNQVKSSLAISSINFSHPLLKGVFDKEFQNFQFPKVKSYYKTKLINNSSILKFENGVNFIAQIHKKKTNVYWFSSSLSDSNFKNSSLIVPVFYNFGLLSKRPTRLYYTIGHTQHIDVMTQLKDDEVLTLTLKSEEFIPIQNITENKVSIITNDKPVTSGFSEIKKDEKIILNLAFNYERNESNLTSIALKDYFDNSENIYFEDSVSKAFNNNKEKNKTTSLWHLFLLLAFISIVLEIVLLKYLKS